MATVTQPVVRVVTEAQFERNRENGTLVAGGFYAVSSPRFSPSPLYAFSIDGEGCYWYDSREEMLNDVG